MAPTYDTIVAGLGIMGSSIAAELAGRGNRVLAVEARWPQHRHAASAGDSRILRLIHPHFPHYASDAVPALEAWHRLEATTGNHLFQPTGGLLVSRADGPVLSSFAAAAESARIAYRLFASTELRSRYPWLHFRQADEGFLDLNAGILLADRCVTAYQQAAVTAGAELRFGTPVEFPEIMHSWRSSNALRISSEKVSARHLVLAIGAWLGSAPDLLRWPEVSIERTVSHWFSPGNQVPPLDADNSPYVEWIDEQLELCLIPSLHGRVKVKTHHTGQRADPASGPAPPTAAEEEAVKSQLEALSGLNLRPIDAASAMYTNTVGGSFQINRHPIVHDLIVVAACSGHAFKFAPLIAARTAQLCAT
ncbi:FAD-dependent oxidoreductase [Amycolatopsis sp. NPDC059090]|uniref:FAD-dependent oxidoreductase n=1 Tax=unclassified Amycolatopsis TaxID=2618356 RepID=UPI00366AFA34